MAQKIIVTHISPDLDGIPAIWLLKKFHPEFKNARVEVVPAGDNTYNSGPVDSDPNVVHVDVGGGKFDHHKTDKFTCAAKLVHQWLIDEGYIDKKDEALKRIIKVVCEIDHGWDISKWSDPASDKCEFSLHNLVSGMKLANPQDNDKLLDWTLDGLEALYKLLESKVQAEEELKEADKFKTRWGRGVAVYTRNDGVMDLAIKNGYAVVVRKDPNYGYVRITGSSSRKVDLIKAYNKIIKRDKIGSWFLHASKVLLRNGSSRNPVMKPTKMSLEEVVKILKES